MAHYNSYSLFDGHSYMDNCGNSRANTCTQTRLRGRVVFISYRTNPGLPGLVVIHNNRTNRMPLAAMDHLSF